MVDWVLFGYGIVFDSSLDIESLMKQLKSQSAVLVPEESLTLLDSDEKKIVYDFVPNQDFTSNFLGEEIVIGSDSSDESIGNTTEQVADLCRKAYIKGEALRKFAADLNLPKPSFRMFKLYDA